MYAGLVAMVIAAIALLIPILIGVEGDEPMTETSVAYIPPKPEFSPEMTEAIADAREWTLYWLEAHAEYEDEFTALFNSYTYKVSKNGRSMVNGKFVAMPKGN